MNSKTRTEARQPRGADREIGQDCSPARRLILSAMMLFAWCLPAAALEPRVIDELAGPAPTFPLELGAGQRVEIETRNLSPGADTVLHLVRAGDLGQVAFDDDGGREPLASRIVFTAPAEDGYLIILRPYNNNGPDASCQIHVDGVPIGTQETFGGRFHTSVRAGDEVHALAWDSPRRSPWLMAIGYGGNLLAADREGGVGDDAKLTVPSYAWGVLVAGQSERASVRFIVNDVSTDSDGDGLGAGLEAELCSCDSPSQPTCGVSCDPSQNPYIASTLDSDRDGLRDRDEVLGKDGDYAAHPDDFPQYLPGWGANPARKDLFVELDWLTTTVPLSVLAAQDLRNTFRRSGTHEELQNRDGSDGIEVHLDCGSDAPYLPYYRDMGGAKAGDYPTYSRPTDAEFAPVRRGLFHRGVLNPGGGGQGGLGPYFWCGSRDGYGCAHELGHNLSLDHGGRRSSIEQNSKPNYRSIMNYAMDPEVGFSRDEFATAVLNPQALCEADGLATSVRSEVAFLESSPFGYLVEASCGADGNPRCGVDWNRDGSITGGVACTDLVEAAPNYASFDPELGRYYWSREHPEFIHSGPDPNTTPSMVRVLDDRFHIAYRTQEGEIRILSTSDRFGVGCSYLFRDCSRWSTLVVAGVSGEAGPAVAALMVGGIEYLLIVWEHVDGGVLRYAIYDANDDQVADGYVPGTSGLLHEPVLVNKSHVGDPNDDVLLLFRTGAEEEPGPVFGMYKHADFTSWSEPTPQTLVSEQEVDVVSVIAAAPYPQGVRMVVTTAHDEDGTYEPRWFEWVGDDQWMLLTGTGIESDDFRDVPDVRYGLAWVPQLGLPDGRWYFSWVRFNEASRPNVRIDMTDGSDLFENDAVYDNYYFRTSGGGIDLYGWRPRLAEDTLRMATMYGTRSQLELRPFASGIIDVELKSDNDWELMERGLCASLQPGVCEAPLCGGAPGRSVCLFYE